MQVCLDRPLGPIQTNLHNRINVCIKNLIGSFPYAFAYRPINFFMHTFMRLCKFVWIGPNLCRSFCNSSSATAASLHFPLYALHSLNPRVTLTQFSPSPLALFHTHT